MLKTKYIKTLEILTSILILITFIVSLYSILNMRIYRTFVPDTLFSGTLSQDVVSLVVSILLLVVLVKLRNSSEKIYLVWISPLSDTFFMHTAYMPLTECILCSSCAMSRYLVYLCSV